MEKSIFSKGKGYNALAAQTVTISTATDTNGAIIDTLGFNSMVVNLHGTRTNGSISAITFQEGDASDLSDAADINDKYLLVYPTQFPLTASFATGASVRVGCVSKKRYVRLKITTTGATVGWVLTGECELSDATSQPTDVYSSVLSTSDINAPSTTADSIVTSPKRTT